MLSRCASRTRVFLVGVDHEDHMSESRPVLDAAERTASFVRARAAASAAPSWVGVGFAARGEHSSRLTQTLDQPEMVFQLVSVPADAKRELTKYAPERLGPFGDAVMRRRLVPTKQDTSALLATSALTPSRGVLQQPVRSARRSMTVDLLVHR